MATSSAGRELRALPYLSYPSHACQTDILCLQHWRLDLDFTPPSSLLRLRLRMQ